MTPGFWIQVVGSKKTGKTSLLENLTGELVRRGCRVCCVKHTHEAPRLDGAETDTARLREAGAHTTALVGASYTVVFRATGGESLERAAHLCADPGDIVLAEGFKNAPGRKIAIAGGDLDIAELDGVIAVVGDPEDLCDGPVFRSDQIEELCDLIESATAERAGDWATSLTIDGREIHLNAFVQDIMASGLLGMSTALEGVDGATVLEVRCRRAGRSDRTDSREETPTADRHGD
jgi:molybdopterin-guanine dinucleotide biosynthesis protein B